MIKNSFLQSYENEVMKLYNNTTTSNRRIYNCIYKYIKMENTDNLSNKSIPFLRRTVTRRATNELYMKLNFPSKRIKSNEKSADETKETPPSLSRSRSRRIPTTKYLTFQKNQW